MKPQINKLKPYQAGKYPAQVKKEYNVDKVVKLSSNENPYGYSPKVQEVVQSLLSSCSSLYPDGSAPELRKVLSDKLCVNENQFIFGSGADEVIQIISRTLLSKGDNIVTTDLTYPQYRHHAIIEGCEVREIPLTDGYFDLDKILDAIDSNTKIVWVCNPNNPTGTYLSEETLLPFLHKVPKETLVVLDEAYYEYICEMQDFPQSIKLLKDFTNILILRTFSKAYGLAAFRIGYAIGNESLIEKFNVAKLPFNTTTFAQAAAIAAIDDQEFLDFCIEQNKVGIQQYESAFRDLNIDFYPTHTNCIFILTNQSNEWFETLIKRGFIVRPYPNGIRITIGTKEQNEEVISILRQMMQYKQTSSF
ncbi:MAG: histidinol-phosphate transaminase [Bacillales bacterium]|jgi:histidinol-phosphate aminotransferase|nr:histidinol-phosphate transaminase [Bacillales bacterium]